ncbi:MAG TPA: MerR family transcriptional regulator [Flammeovirgaceae bacterium]|nr:MerR family transcriptional regulator [Flammeovirgaceae bacterium]
MPYKERDIEKVYYTIGEVAEEFNVATSLIRFWESEFDILKPKKNKKGNRQFTRDDIQKLRLIYHLVKERGFTLQGAKAMLKNNAEELQDNLDMIESLKKVRNFLVQLKEQL